MTEREALTVFRTIQKCRHQALHTNDCGNCERCQYYLEQEQIDGAVALAISALEKQEQAENEWCPDCAEYGKENHCCHRFTKVIRQTVEECKREYANEGWIPCSERLPEDDTEVFVYLFDHISPYIAWICDGHWYTEEFEVERENEPVAWMPLPEPYKAEEES